MNSYSIQGGNKLFGKVKIGGAKNSILPLLASTIIGKSKYYLQNCPKIQDVFIMIKILESLNAKCMFFGDTLFVDTENINSYTLPQNLTDKIRASFFLVGSLICRFNNAIVNMPGGCNIGLRPIDIHLDALNKLNINYIHNENLAFTTDKVIGENINLRFPSVGATENVMMASVFCEGTTIIKNPAREPEIVELQNFLNMQGAKICGAGSKTIKIEGVDKLHKSEYIYKVLPDRIEEGTFITAVCLTGGEIEIIGGSLKNNSALLQIVCNNACKMYAENGKIVVRANGGNFKSFNNVKVLPYPYFPTDLQPQLCALSCIACGTTIIDERIFENRFDYAMQLVKMGADISINGTKAIVNGVEKLIGTTVLAGDLRGGASLVLAGLKAEGQTIIKNIHHINRGYENLHEKLANLGGLISLI